jgi:hypothetical protein
VPKRNKIRLVLAAGVTTTALGIGGVALAAYLQTTSSNRLDATTEGFTTVTVEGSQNPATGLLPGDSADIKLKVTNPNPNLKAVVNAIALSDLKVDETSVPAGLATTCKGFIVTSTLDLGSDILPLSIPKGGNHTFNLAKGIVIAANASGVCAGMKFSTKWDVQFEGVR